ncbi:MAG: hypothetical protein ABEI06_05305 [Halobacteriaceae archaeon]
MPRQPAMLTPDQRAYLRGEKDYNADVEGNVRYEIRQRVQHTLFDFAILLQELEPRDRKQIFKDIRAPGERDDDQINEETYREDELGGLVQTLGFLYLGADDATISFETVLEHGISVARSTDQAHPFAVRGVSVTIDEELETDIEQLVEKVAEGQRLEGMEYFGLLRYVISDPATIRRAAATADFDIEPKLTEGESLTRGESIIAISQVSHGENPVQADAVFDLLHDDVSNHLGLP